MDSIPLVSRAPAPGSARELALLMFERAMAARAEAAASAGPGGERKPANAGAAAEQLCETVWAALSRWVGAYGARALMMRALVRAQSEHLALAGVTVAPASDAAAPSPCLTGVAESFSLHDPTAARDAFLAFLTALVDVMGRLIGDDLAVRILEPATLGLPPARASTVHDAPPTATEP